MDLKTSYKGISLNPIYAGSSAVATVSENGKILATPVLDEINIIDLTPGSRKILHKISNEDEQEITALKLTPDGQYLTYVSQAQLLKIFHLKTGKVVRSMKISSPSYILDADSTSTLLAVGGTDGSIIVVDIENGYITHSFKGHGGTISSLKFYGQLNSKIWLLASGDTNGMVKVWDLVKRKCLHTLQEHTSAVRGLDIIEVPDNDEPSLNLLSGGRDDIINLWDFNMKKKCKLLKTLPVNQQVESCGFLKDGDGKRIIYTAGGDAIFQLIDSESGSVLKRTNKPIEELFIIGVLPILSNSQMFLVLSDQTLQLINVEEDLKNDEDTIQVTSSIAGNHGIIADMRYVGPELNKLALATNSPSLRIIPVPDLSGPEASLPLDVEIYEGHEDLLNSLDATEDGLWIATASKDNTAIVWRYNENSCKFDIYAKYIGHSAAVTAVGLPNIVSKGYPEFLLTASNDLTIKKWIIPKPTASMDVQIIKVSEYTRHAHEKDINALSVSPNDSIFATASYDKTCKIWNLENGELEATLANHKRGLWDVSFCQYDKLLATSSGDKTVKIWSLDTFSVMKTLEGHTNAVQRCSFINKQKQLISCGADGLIKIWDCSSGECLRTLDGHNNRLWALSTMNDGDMIVSADADGVFQFWKDCTEQEIEEEQEKAKLQVEQEQSLQNYMSQGDWTNAFLLAMTLDHPMRLFNVLKRALGESRSRQDTEEGKIEVIFNEELDQAISILNDEQLILLMKRCRDWNTNAKTHTIAQRTIRCILMHHNIAKLSEIPGMVKIVDAIIPYTQRHFTRVDNLVEQSYILDYALVEMDKLF
ncbi:ASN_HP2_G0035580.mRNA.1.CDS.1 [Saccharomyces cerevisiae]|nr:BGN_3a_G0036940.mRNA.1.CDS.1 [Saccharomyces cerevisiae]CAI5298324.1 ASN_HP2_G0035580.mRNA.1.CDS.1 [Saccharomyces cerevisiae]CAI5304603.1 BFH_HP2_G0036580.mRNA.1.CDS.1 [Saccharomyces cerevisiae]CAI6627269.1 ASN_HP2_G0035580.mRNA.1.CDS.1 [Saccharomyces cerevisiae]CAI6654777.1 BFH_HP2_G0036580.mRNA.1.CDS.1 [Saccharomyces cerevisiae]